MALFPKPEDTPRTGLLLNKRFVRIVIAAASFFFLTILLLWRNPETKALPPLGFKESPEFYPYTTYSDYYPVSLDPADKSTEELCATFPKHLLDLVQPVLKMGHGEDRAKIESQLDSVSACFAPDQLLIFSDLDETIRNHSVIDILANLPEGYYDEEQNPDIKHYLAQKAMRANGTLGVDKEATKRISGWTIDKYKFLPQIERAWLLKPDRPFYFFYETDTYVVWDNVFRFLQTFDPDKPIYMGSPSPGREDKDRRVKTWFANGGPGYVLSRGAVKALIHRESSEHGQYSEPSVTQRLLPLLRNECCGDSVLGWALWNANIALQGYWPMFNPHPLHGIPFSDRYWCQPVLTLHKTSPKDMVDVWRWEFGQRQNESPLIYSDLYNFQHPGKPAIKENWDNGDWDSWTPGPEAGLDSFEKCEQACKKDDSCVQWNWRGKDEKKCILMRSIRYGVERKEEKKEEVKDEKKGGKKGEKKEGKVKEEWVDFKAGWVEDRIDKWRKDKECKVVEWVGPSITRIF
ncbi:hypothetical protein PT974_03887 [Cladobotryum mycophilum]|uniref:N-acetylgalactosaminide beta-1,3-galactosyltransferase n=1 Tax=Cladobotryum mycophilum TaxID=491253 RepID=A0ABR0STX5_9HYPO